MKELLDGVRVGDEGKTAVVIRPVGPARRARSALISVGGECSSASNAGGRLEELNFLEAGGTQMFFAQKKRHTAQHTSRGIKDPCETSPVSAELFSKTEHGGYYSERHLSCQRNLAGSQRWFYLFVLTTVTSEIALTIKRFSV
jgi:hypothetical protein